MAGWLEQKLGSIWLFGRHDRQPRGPAEVDVRFLREAEGVRIELERLPLVVDEDARDIDPHSEAPFSFEWATVP